MHFEPEQLIDSSRQAYENTQIIYQPSFYEQKEDFIKLMKTKQDSELYNQVQQNGVQYSFLKQEIPGLNDKNIKINLEFNNLLNKNLQNRQKIINISKKTNDVINIHQQDKEYFYNKFKFPQTQQNINNVNNKNLEDEKISLSNTDINSFFKDKDEEEDQNSHFGEEADKFNVNHQKSSARSNQYKQNNHQNTNKTPYKIEDIQQLSQDFLEIGEKSQEDRNRKFIQTNDIINIDSRQRLFSTDLQFQKQQSQQNKLIRQRNVTQIQLQPPSPQQQFLQSQNQKQNNILKKLHLQNICKNDENFQKLNFAEKMEIVNKDDLIHDFSLVLKQNQTNNNNNHSFNYNQSEQSMLLNHQIQQFSRNIVPSFQAYQHNQPNKKCFINEQDAAINPADIKFDDISNILGETIQMHNLNDHLDHQNLDQQILNHIYLPDKKQQYNNNFENENSYINQNASTFNQTYNDNQEIGYCSRPQDLKNIEYQNYHQQVKKKIPVNDKNFDVSQEEIINETKSQMDWMLEDLQLIKQAKLDSELLPDNFSHRKILQQELKNQFQHKLVEVLYYAFFPNDYQKHYQENLRLQNNKINDYFKQSLQNEKIALDQQKASNKVMEELKKVLNNIQSIKNKLIDDYPLINIVKIVLEDLMIICKEYEQLKDDNQKLHLEVQQIEQLRLKEQKKPGYLKDYERGKTKLRNFKTKK